MAFHYTAGRFKSFLDSGAVNASGRLYTFTSGTTTHKDAYTDATLGTPCTYVNDGTSLYIQLNSRGEAQVWLGTGAYTMVEKTSTGAAIDTTDGVDPNAAAVGNIDLNGYKLLNVGTGTAGAPSITYQTDPTTGLFFVSSGVMALSAGGLEKFRCNSAGALVTGSLEIDPVNTAGPQLGIRLYDSGTGAGEGPWIVWESANRVDGSRIQGIGDTTGGALDFYTNPAASGTGTKRLRIDQLGGSVFYGAASTPKNAIGSSSTAFTLDCSKSNVHTLTMTGNVASGGWTISNPYDGQTVNLFITQDATGSRTLGWPASFKWPGGTAGTISTAASARDLLVMTYDVTTAFWYCTLSKAFS